MIPPQRATAKLADKRQYNDKFIHYFFEFINPPTLQFQAGQYVSMQVSERGDRRSYSICSAPAENHGFELLVDVTPQGLGSQFLQTIPFGQEVNVLAPLGVFFMSEPSAEPAVALLATGSGVAPFRSMILDRLQTHQDTRPMTLYWGLRHEEQMFWQDEFQELSEAFPNFHFHPVISQASEQWPLCRGRVTNCLSVHEQLPNTGYYICGNEMMMKDTIELLTAKGVTPDKIHHEKFY